MGEPNPKISVEPPIIRQLDEAVINRIAAGEVVERPASAVKELVENALDAGAQRVTVDYAEGGKTLIRVSDDGCGMAAADLPLAIGRHATSKIDGSDLLAIHSFGFRGEALASLGSVGRLTITSRPAGGEGHALAVTGGAVGDVRPSGARQGTVVELRDLFFATPARLKFLRTDRAEAQAIGDVIRRLAVAEPGVSFTLRDVSAGREARTILDLPGAIGAEAMARRLDAVIARDFTENAVGLDAERDGLRLTGFAGLPTYSRGAAVAQYLCVNGRPVRDKLMSGALRAAYLDVMSRDRHPVAAVFVDCDPHLVDVNVHPAKAEVRFRDPGLARGLIVSGIRHALAGAGHRSSATVAAATLGAFQAPPAEPRVYQMDRPAPRPAPGFVEAGPPSARFEPVAETDGGETFRPLGAARAQVHENYIVAQTEDGVVIVDQHAAHERLVYERLKSQAHAGPIPAQVLLIPEIVTLSPTEADRLIAVAEGLNELGLTIEPFGPDAVAVRATPALLGEVDAAGLVRDLTDLLDEGRGAEPLKARIDAVLSRVACHGSVRSGRAMRADEMNALLREMEATPGSGQCNHGRPTYVELKLTDIERLFGRT